MIGWYCTLHQLTKKKTNSFARKNYLHILGFPDWFTAAYSSLFFLRLKTCEPFLSMPVFGITVASWIILDSRPAQCAAARNGMILLGWPATVYLCCWVANSAIGIEKALAGLAAPTTKNHIDSGPLLFQMSILIKNWWYHTIHETHIFNLLGFPIIAPLHTWCTWAADGLSNPLQLGSPTHSANHCDPLGIKDTILLPSWGNHSTMRWDPCRIIAMQAPGFLQGMTFSVNSFHAAHINRDLKNHRAVSHGFPDIS